MKLSNLVALSCTGEMGVSYSRSKCGFVGFCKIFSLFQLMNKYLTVIWAAIFVAQQNLSLSVSLAPTQMRSKERRSPRSFSRYDDYEREGRYRRSRSRSYERRRSRSPSYERRPRRSDSPRE